MADIITLTTDFGPGEYVGAMKGAILAVDPEATIVDIDHNVRPQDVRHGAYALLAAVPAFPFAVHVGIVDPGVGTGRRALLVVCEGAILTGPDNGLLLPAARRLGIKEVRQITNRSLGRKDISDTFHGRDLFGPVAAHILKGTKVKDVGPILRDFVDLDFGKPKKTQDGFEAHVITHDRFGNVITNMPRSLCEKTWSLRDRLKIALGGYELTVPLVRTYGEVQPGEFLAAYSSSGFLEISRRESSAAAHLNVGPDAPIHVSSA
jgi:S-adenosylmethionine hydrolase